jgi:hypothetical protein
MPIDKAKKIEYNHHNHHNHNKKQIISPALSSKQKNIPTSISTSTSTSTSTLTTHRNPLQQQHQQSALPKTFRLHRRGKYSFL